jgi:hypothetical protein
MGRNNLSFGFFRPKIGSFSVKFRTFVLENTQLAIRFEPMCKICLETFPIFAAKKVQTQVHTQKGGL